MAWPGRGDSRPSWRAMCFPDQSAQACVSAGISTRSASRPASCGGTKRRPLCRVCRSVARLSGNQPEASCSMDVCEGNHNAFTKGDSMTVTKFSGPNSWPAICALAALAFQAGSLAAQEKTADGWITLFNGKDVTGWKLKNDKYHGDPVHGRQRCGHQGKPRKRTRSDGRSCYTPRAKVN